MELSLIKAYQFNLPLWTKLVRPCFRPIKGSPALVNLTHGQECNHCPIHMVIGEHKCKSEDQVQ